MENTAIRRHLSFTPNRGTTSPENISKEGKNKNIFVGRRLWSDDDDSDDSGIGHSSDSDDDVLSQTNADGTNRERFRTQRSYDDDQPMKRLRVESLASINDVISAVEALHESHLIADGTKPYTLPTIPGKHEDLKCISSETLNRVLNKKYEPQIEQFLIIDCRYPYEFRGGHIKGAANLYKHENILNLLSENVDYQDSTGRVVLIFHCEFSSERGPKLYRFLRNKDREANQDCYPRLQYPEMYLLNGGYKRFYETNPDLCDPRNYVPMLHDDHSKDLRHFRVKSKSWPRENRRPMQRLKFD